MRERQEEGHSRQTEVCSMVHLLLWEEKDMKEVGLIAHELVGVGFVGEVVCGYLIKREIQKREH